ncbi:Inner membrane transport protein YajR [Tepidimonas alkaliphilus]|uniref:Inner membrane transport protein YajR n=1 Tax=Tepidimonas alkaliphilus TaxID=2588942 RepID=A0A554W7E3_9BURK|nr:MFS transporter [Tepidimonas alkaliphilus]TSE19489.1 Inner membrane transport protein YajR [Tepidimonas alkaliphilus]
MLPAERRASFALAGVFALRMLGLFLVLPVFALEAARLPGGEHPAHVGLALGIYGLVQAALQVPLGWASDRWGRKRVILAGLALFGLGSVLAAWAPTLAWLTVARAVQGAGAISAAVTALLADLTRDTVRTKAMALVGASIGLSFALSLVAAPPLAAWIGLSGLFGLTAALTLLGMAAVAWIVPAEPPRSAGTSTSPRAALWGVLRDPALLRLDLGVLALHALQTALWVAVPGLLVAAGLPKSQHWQVYLAALLISFAVMGGVLFRWERRGHLGAVLRAAIALLLLAQALLAWAQTHGAGIALLALALTVFFTGFNTLEASQPSLVSRLAPPAARGAALGVYNTLQSVGLFAGGALGGWLTQRHGPHAVFLAGMLLACGWLLIAWRQPLPDRTPYAAAS